MKPARNFFNASAFVLIVAGLALAAHFFAKPVLIFIHNLAIWLSYIVAVVYLAIHTGVLLTEGRTNNLAKKYKSYQDLDLESSTVEDRANPTADEIAVAKNKAYESSSTVWVYMCFIWVTPLLCAFHENFRFFPMNAFNFLALISGLYIWIRQLILIISRYGDSYSKAIPEKTAVGWFALKCVSLMIADLYYIAILLVAFGIFEASTFVLVPR